MDRVLNHGPNGFVIDEECLSEGFFDCNRLLSKSHTPLPMSVSVPRSLDRPNSFGDDTPPMRVVAVSRGTPSWQNIHGHQVRTSIARAPSKDPLVVNFGGIADNQLAAHNAEVYAFFAHHYDYWTGKLGIDRSSWDWCYWGENLTVESGSRVDERKLHLGDVWEVGCNSKSVLLEVCGGRVPCSRLAWRCGQPDVWLKEVAESGYCGVYLRVIRNGLLSVGDQVKIHRRGQTTLSVASIAQTAFAEGSLRTRDIMNLLVNQPGLQSMNRTLFQRKLALLDDQASVGRNGWNGWREFFVARTANEKGDIISLYLKATDGEPLAAYAPGQYVTVKLPNETIRCWSISEWTGLGTPPYYRVSTKRSSASWKWMHSFGIPSTRLSLCKPTGTFTLDWAPMFPPRQIYISAGIGITPIITMLKAHLSHDAMKQIPPIWIHVTRNKFTFAFSEELPQSPEIIRRLTFFTSPHSGEDIPGQDYYASGRPNASFFQNLIGEAYYMDPMRITPVQVPGSNSICYICGPQSFEKDIRSFLKNCGVSDQNIRTESFSAPSSSPGTEGDRTVSDGDNNPRNAMRDATVRFTKSKRDATWKSKENCSILELAEKAGLTPSYGCRAGACGSCTARLVSGRVNGGSQPDGDSVLLCSARPATAVIEVEI